MTTRQRFTTIKLGPGSHSIRSSTRTRGLAAAVGFGLLALAFDQACAAFKRQDFKHSEALSDGAAHIATALAVSLPAAPFVQDTKRFVALATLSAVAIDLDHVVAARSAKLISCMTMPAKRFWPGR